MMRRKNRVRVMVPLAGSVEVSLSNSLNEELSRSASIEAKGDFSDHVPLSAMQAGRIARLYALSFATAETIALLAYGVAQ